MDIKTIMSEALKGVTADGMITLGLGLITLFISMLTIRITKKQFKDDKRISIKPYLNCEIKSIKSQEDLNEFDFKWTNFIKLENAQNKYADINFYEFSLILKNIGLGHAVDCKVINVRGDIIAYSKAYKDIGVIQTKEEIRFRINLNYGIEKKYKHLVNKKYNSIQEFNIIKEKVNKETLEKIYIDLIYVDVLNNAYKKTICLAFSLNLDFVINTPLSDFQVTKFYTCNRIYEKFEILQEESIDKLLKQTKLKKLIKKHKKS